jgi:putative aldouronate transport system permease protein
LVFKESITDRIYLSVINIICLFVVIVTAYPFIYVLSMSISSPENVLTQSIWLLPKGFSLKSYQLAFSNPDIWQSYMNTIWYTVVGTTINIIMTVIAAYVLSRRRFFLKKQIMKAITVTMFFNGGLIPQFLLVRSLNLYNTRWAVILPTAVYAWYIIITRQYFYTIPESMHECATIDGAGDFRILARIYLPLCQPIIAVMGLFYAVSQWNNYFSAMLYLPDAKLQPLQLYLVKVLVQNSTDIMKNDPGMVGLDRTIYSMQLKYAVIIIVILPIICVYPSLQKYFIQGVTVGAVKE